MIITQIVETEIDMAEARELLALAECGKSMKARISALYDLFEQAKFDEAIALVRTWKHGKDGLGEKLWMDMKVYRVLCEIVQNGVVYTVKK